MEFNQGMQEKESPQEFAIRLKIDFNDLFLLSRALTHRSYLNEYPEALEDNERLEFLGDAVLDFLVGAWLYNRYPEMTEGGLTRMRSALVRTEQLSEFARQIKLGSALRLGRGEADSGGRDRSAILCAAFEAFVGAIYLDGGISVVRKFVEPFLESVASDLLQAGKIQDPKSELQEWTQAQGYGPPSYKTISTSGPDHAKIFEIEVVINGQVYGFGTGHSKQIAAKDAARKVLRSFGLD